MARTQKYPGINLPTDSTSPKERAEMPVSDVGGAIYKEYTNESLDGRLDITCPVDKILADGQENDTS